MNYVVSREGVRGSRRKVRYIDQFQTACPRSVGATRSRRMMRTKCADYPVALRRATTLTQAERPRQLKQLAGAVIEGARTREIPNHDSADQQYFCEYCELGIHL